MKKIYYTVETTDKNGIEEVAMFNTLEEAEKCFYRSIECDDYLATSYLNENTETELDVETKNLISYEFMNVQISCKAFKQSEVI